MAAKWYVDAASSHNPTAMYRLGLFYEYGKLFQKDLNSARKMYERAMARGHKGAESRLAVLSVLNEMNSSPAMRIDDMELDASDDELVRAKLS